MSALTTAHRVKTSKLKLHREKHAPPYSTPVQEPAVTLRTLLGRTRAGFIAAGHKGVRWQQRVAAVVAVDGEVGVHIIGVGTVVVVLGDGALYEPLLRAGAVEVLKGHGGKDPLQASRSADKC